MQQQPPRYPGTPRSEDVLGATASLEAIRLPFDVDPEAWTLDVGIPREIDPAHAGPFAQSLSHRPHEGHGNHRDDLGGVTPASCPKMLHRQGDLRCGASPATLDKEAMTRHDYRELSGRGGSGSSSYGLWTTPHQLTKKVGDIPSYLFRRERHFTK
jgi:hypothetical protein